MKKVTILGAGITGLFLAYKLSDNFKVVLIEKEKNIGGMSTSFKHKDFLLDYGPHKIYTELPGIIEEITKLVDLNKIKKINSIYLEKTYFDFPLQISQLLKKIPLKGFKAGLDIFSNFLGKKQETNYENFLINNFGTTIYSLIFKNYAKKIWISPEKLDIDLAKKRVAISNIFQLLKSILFKDTEKISAEYFYYPKISISQLIDSLEKGIKKNNGEILTNKKITSIKTKKQVEIKMKNKKIKSDILVSTIPLTDLTNYLGEDVLINNAKNLNYNSTNIFYFILKKKKALKENWIFFPELKIPFHRISEQKSFSDKCCPKEKTALMIETTLDKKYKKEIKQKLIDLNLIQEKEIKEIFIKKLEKAYPLYTKGYNSYLENILDYLDNEERIYLLGRHGLFNYNNMDQCIDMAKRLAKHLIQNKTKRQWKKTRKVFNSYRIVD